MIKLFTLSGGDNGLVAFLEKVFNTFFDPEKNNYDNINASSGGIVSLRLIIIGLMLGFCAAAIGSLYEKGLIGGFVKKLLSENCIGSERAKALHELGYGRSPAIRSSLRGGSTLKRWVRCVEEDEFYASLEEKRAEFEAANPEERFVAPKFKRDPDTMHFYIPEDLKYKADVKFSTKGANIVSVILVIVVSVVLCAALCSVIPDMLTFVDNFITIIKN
jgi:hypothetical protein